MGRLLLNVKQVSRVKLEIQEILPNKRPHTTRQFRTQKFDSIELKTNNIMPHAAIETKERPQLWHSKVGRRTLPFSGLEYIARAPQGTKNANGIFDTVWLPVNASHRVVLDRQQDIMHMSYSGMLSKLNRDQDPLSIPLPTAYKLTRRHLPKIELEPKPSDTPQHVKIATWKTGHNSQRPFATLGKPTCGYFFTRNISHKKQLIGINATNTVKWRSNVDTMGIK